MPHVVYVVTHPMTASGVLRGQLAAMRAHGWRVTLVASPGAQLDAVAASEGVEAVALPMAREISPVADARALAALVRLLRRLRPDAVNASTPKAGLLGMLAARAVGVPARIYTLRGLRLETTAGPKRAVLTATERVAAGCAHRVVAVSPSLGRRAVELGLVPARKVVAIGAGSSNGIVAARFSSPDPAAVAALRARLGLADGTPVVGFVGRLTRDKGVAELVDAFDRLRAARPGLRLLLVGPAEAGDPLPPGVLARIEADPAILAPGSLADAAASYALMTVVAFPSHREGFPNVPLEAAAAGKPVVAARATGSVDAVVDGTTGTLVPVGDAAALAAAVGRYLDDPALATRHGAAGRSRAHEDFAPARIWDALDALYGELLGFRRPGGSSGSVTDAFFEPLPDDELDAWQQ